MIPGGPGGVPGSSLGSLSRFEEKRQEADRRYAETLRQINADEVRSRVDRGSERDGARASTVRSPELYVASHSAASKRVEQDEEPAKNLSVDMLKQLSRIKNPRIFWK